jgi:peptidylprolyl isomerase
VLKSGCGQAVESYNSPIVRYSARPLNGASFSNKEADEMISLEDSIPGFRKGILGMKEGEARVLYIHPDLGYGDQGRADSASLLVFEVEVIKADASSDASSSNGMEFLPFLKDTSELR